MNFPSREFDQAVAALCHGTIHDPALADLHELLSTEPEAMDEYLWRVELHAELAANPALAEPSPAAPDSEWASTSTAASTPASSAQRTSVERSRWSRSGALLGLVAFVALAAIAVATGFWLTRPAEAIARIVDLEEPRWMSVDAVRAEQDVIRRGDRVELRSGSAEILFDSGARMELVGPSIIEALGALSTRLVLGEVNVVADTTESAGFTVLTPRSTFVDIGTAFTASVAPDGLSRLSVTEGEVDVVFGEASGPSTAPRLGAGEALYVEPGDRTIITRIEEGDGTAAFRFPSIQAPSNKDHADQTLGSAKIRVVEGELRQRPGGSASGPASVLLDGRAQSRQDAPLQSAFFETGRGRFLVDLGTQIRIKQINAYSWHQHREIPEHRHRASQRFTLYGHAGETAPDRKPDTTGDPGEHGWIRVARVNSDAFFRVRDALDRPSQQASSIRATSGEIGHFRHLLWVVDGPSFFGEFDVFGSP